MRVTTFSPSEYFGANMYIINFDGYGAVIDPSCNYLETKQFLDDNFITIKYIILTHAHFDHILEIDSWRNNTLADVIIGDREAHGLRDSRINCYKMFLNEDKTYDGPYVTVNDGDILNLGNGELRIMATPGHSAGSISLLADNNLFVGDTVFAGSSVGRVDLPGGNIRKLYESIDIIKSLPPETVIYPGHGPKTSVIEIKRNFI